MPELPEVEQFARYFASHALDQPVSRVKVLDDRILGATTPARIRSALAGRRFTTALRHGKHLFAATDTGPWLHLHFGMAGDLFYYSRADEQPRFARVVIEFRDGTRLAYDDMRLFGVVDLVKSPEEYVESQGLGPDAVDPKLSTAWFARALNGRRGAIKPLLMSQELVAGLGNLYADEALFDSGILPVRPTESLSGDEKRKLFRSFRRILRIAIDRRLAGKEVPSHWLFEHRNEGEPCPRCGASIRRSTVGGRTTYFCAKHQA